MTYSGKETVANVALIPVAVPVPNGTKISTGVFAVAGATLDFSSRLRELLVALALFNAFRREVHATCTFTAYHGRWGDPLIPPMVL